MALCKEIGTDSGKTLMMSTTGAMALDLYADN